MRTRFALVMTAALAACGGPAGPATPASTGVAAYVNALKKNEPLFWSPGKGTDVWEMFCACIAGDLNTVKQLLEKDPSLTRSHYEYRTPLSFAVRKNRLEVAAYLIEHGASFAFGNLLEMARDRGYQEMEKLLEAALAGARGTGLKGEPVAA